MNKVVSPKIGIKITQDADLQNADDISPRMTSKVAAAKPVAEPDRVRTGGSGDRRPEEARSGQNARKRKIRRAEHNGQNMRNCEASRFVPTSCGSGKEAAACSVKLWDDKRDGDSGRLIEFPPADTDMRHRSASPACVPKPSCNRVADPKHFLRRKMTVREFSPQNPCGPNAEASARRLTSPRAQAGGAGLREYLKDYK